MASLAFSGQEEIRSLCSQFPPYGCPVFIAERIRKKTKQRLISGCINNISKSKRKIFQRGTNPDRLPIMFVVYMFIIIAYPAVFTRAG